MSVSSEGELNSRRYEPGSKALRYICYAPTLSEMDFFWQIYGMGKYKETHFFVDKRRHLVRAFFIVLLSVYRYFFAFFEYKFKKNIFLLIMIS